MLSRLLCCFFPLFFFLCCVTNVIYIFFLDHPFPIEIKVIYLGIALLGILLFVCFCDGGGGDMGQVQEGCSIFSFPSASR